MPDRPNRTGCMGHHWLGRSLLIAILLVGTSSNASAASFFVVPNTSGAVLVGDVITVDLFLATEQAEGSGSLDVNLGWGWDSPGLSGAPTTPWIGLGALSVFEAPALLDPVGFDATFSSDCAAGSGSANAPTGDCAISVSWDALAPGNTRLASMSFAYDWRTAPGWEICVFEDDPDCVEAGQATYVLIDNIFVSDTPIPGALFSIGTLGNPFIRPIPEPGSALLMGLGLSMLASLRGRVSAPGPSLSRRGLSTEDLATDISVVAGVPGRSLLGCDGGGRYG